VGSPCRRRAKGNGWEGWKHSGMQEKYLCSVGWQGITETKRIHWSLFGMQNRIYGSYLAAIHRILTVRAVWNCFFKK
jgi:hypothetical protein